MKYQISKKEEGVMVISGHPVLTFGEWQVILARELKVQVAPTLSLCQMGSIANALCIGTTLFLNSTLSLEQSTVLAQQVRPGTYLYVAHDVAPKTLLAIASCTRHGVMVLLDSRMPVKHVDQFVAAWRPGPVLLVNIDIPSQVMVRMASQLRPGCCLAVPCSIHLQTTVAIAGAMRPGTFLLLGQGLSVNAVDCIRSNVPKGVTLLCTPMMRGMRLKGPSLFQRNEYHHGPIVAQVRPTAGDFSAALRPPRVSTGFQNRIKGGYARCYPKGTVQPCSLNNNAIPYNGVALYQSACLQKKKNTIENALLLAWMSKHNLPVLSREEVMVVDSLMEMGCASSQPKKGYPTYGINELKSGLI